MDADQESIEIEAAIGIGDDHLAIEHEASIRATHRAQWLLELGEVSVQGLEVAGLDVDIVAIAEDEGAEAVPFRLVDPAIARRDRGGRLCQHRRDRRLDRKGHGPMIRRQHGMIGAMRDIGRRLLIGLAAVVGGVMAIGYAFIFGGVAAPSGDLGTLDVPGDGGAVATRLDDGRPVFVTAAGGAAWGLDAREPRDPGELDVLLSWCPTDEAFIGTRPTSIFAADGSSLPASPGITAYATAPANEDASRLRVEAQTSGRPAAAENRQPMHTCGPGDWVVHSAQPDEIFDPSVAADAEPPGWIWLEGTLMPIGDQALLCDGISPTDGCPTGLIGGGIDPATLPAGGSAGPCLAPVRERVLEGL